MEQSIQFVLFTPQQPIKEDPVDYLKGIEMLPNRNK